MKCRDLLLALNDYVDGDIDPALCEEFSKHLEGCNPCQIVVDNIRKTVTLYKSGRPYELPPEFHEKLRDVLREKWQQKFAADR